MAAAGILINVARQSEGAKVLAGVAGPDLHVARNQGRVGPAAPAGVGERRAAER